MKLIVAMLVVTTALIAQQQTPVRDGGASQSATGTGVLAGVVLNDDAESRPLRRVVVTLNASDVNVARTTITDDEGRFAFAELPAGRFSLVGTKAAYVTTYYGGKRPGRAPAVPIPIANGQTLRNVTIRMMRGGVITGRIFDPNGQPAPMGSLLVNEVRTTSTGERIVATGFVAGRSTFADERGAYRLYGLPPGEYVVTASVSRMGGGADIRSTSAADLQRALMAVGAVRAGTPAAAPPPTQAAVPLLGYTQIYYPGTPDFNSAATISLAAGETRSGVDFPVPLVRMTTLSGLVQAADGRSLAGANTMITLNSVGPLGANGSGLQANPRTGAFTYRSLTPGQYTLIARSTLGGASNAALASTDLWASMEVTLDGREMPELSVTLEPGATVSGRVVLDAADATVPLDMSRVRVDLESLATSARSFGFVPAPTQPDASGAFKFVGVMPGKYRLNATVQNAGATLWSVKSSSLNGADAIDSPVEIRLGETIANAAVTLTSRGTELTGVFRDANGTPTTDYAVIVFSADRRYWTAGARRLAGPIRPGADGRFIVRGLAPGEYFLAAATDIDAAEVTNIATLEELASKAMRITLADGEKKNQDIKIGG